MVQFNLLSGKKAGTSVVARRFPVRIGRSAGAEVCVQEEGVWEEHLQVSLTRDGFMLKTLEGALTALNGEPVYKAVLHNGDTIELGAARIQFWLAETRQAGLGFREGLTWIGIGAMSLGQVALVYCLLNL